jgi:phage terminase large subunit-like protein
VKRKPVLSSLQFFSRLRWLDGTPLLDHVEEYRRTIFTEALDTFREDGAPVYNQVLAGRGKKNFKSCDLVLAAIYCTVVRRSVQGNQSLILASDEGQAGDDLLLARRLVECNPELSAEFEILAKELRLADGSGGIKILPAGDASGLHGKQYSFLGLDEIHTHDDWSVLEALQPDPTRRDALIWITSYDSITDEPGTPLHDIKAIGFAGGDPRLLFSWYSADRCTDPAFADLDPEQRANPSMSSWPEGRAYLDQQRKRLPANIFKRLHLNLPGSASSFVDMAMWDACVDPNATPAVANRGLPIWVGIDASTKHDSTAIVAVTFDQQRIRLIFHRVFQPSAADPLDFEASIENTVRELCGRFHVVQCLFDPWQMMSVSQRLTRQGVRIEEFPQSTPNLTAASQNLFELIQGRNLVLYPDAGMRLAISRAVAVETARGWKISKEKQSHKIDVIVALAMSAHAAVQGHAPVIVTSDLISRILATPPRRPYAPRNFHY